jgi:hypothetical protein
VGGTARSGWLVDGLLGGLGGLVAGGVVAVNMVIYLGVEGGYQASLADVFEHSVVIGILVLVALMAGPVAGVVYMHRRRRLREEQHHT